MAVLECWAKARVANSNVWQDEARTPEHEDRLLDSKSQACYVSLENSTGVKALPFNALGSKQNHQTEHERVCGVLRGLHMGTCLSV